MQGKGILKCTQIYNNIIPEYFYFFSSLKKKMQVLERNHDHLPPEVNLPRTRKAETRVALPNAVPAARNLRLAAKKAAGVSGDHYLVLNK